MLVQRIASHFEYQILTMSSSSSDLEDVVRGLNYKVAIQEAGTASEASFFEDEINGTGLSIFQPLSDLGYFQWSPKGGYTRLKDVRSSEEVTKFIEMNGQPSALVETSKLRLPVKFLQLDPDERDNKFPFGQNLVACLHVAAKRGVSFENTDFVFGGSSLSLFANQDLTDGLFYATKLPNLKTIVLVKHKAYTQDFSAFGFQFERLVTGQSMRSTKDYSSVKHIHTMKVGDYRVLFQAEVDAILDNEPVEVTASNPRYWGNKKVFQMISNGSPRLCHGIKGRGTVEKVQIRSLARLASEAELDCQVTERRILRGMEDIHDQIEHAGYGEIYRITFRGTSIRLTLEKDRDVIHLPSAEIVGELID